MYPPIIFAAVVCIAAGVIQELTGEKKKPKAKNVESAGGEVIPPAVPAVPDPEPIKETASNVLDPQ